jgi:hypothetical protein
VIATAKSSTDLHPTDAPIVGIIPRRLPFLSLNPARSLAS